MGALEVEMNDSVPYDELDPGVRRLVRFLNDNGFETCDSGDGRSKFAPDGTPLMEGAMDVPHVVVCMDADGLAAECDRLREVLTSAGVVLDTIGPEGGACIQGTYDPCLPRRGFALLLGVSDADLVVNTTRTP